MPKLSWVDPLLTSTDSAFQEWTTAVEAALATVGLVRTADTGQIDTTTAVRPGSSSYAGYSIWRFNDALQAVAPVFIKLQYGVGTSTNSPGMTVQMGDGSDGAGNLTGRVSSTYTNRPNGASTPDNPRCFAVHNAWGAALVLRVQSGSTSGATSGFGWAIHRTVSTLGEPTAEGVMLNTTSGASSSPSSVGLVAYHQRSPTQMIVNTTGADVAHCPLSLAGYIVGVSPQIFPVWCATPRVRPMAFLAVAPDHSAPGAGQTFQMAVVGPTPRTYISVSGGLTRHFAWSGTPPSGTSFILWED